MSRLVIIGASGHGKVVADVALLNGYEDIVFLDDDDSRKSNGIYPVVGCTADASNINGDLFVAIGNAEIRKTIMERYRYRRFPKLVHPNAIVAVDSQVGDGTVIMAGAVINPGTRIGRGCIINTGSSVDHDNAVENFVHVSVGAHLCGTVSVGAMSWIGAGAIVCNNIRICGKCMIGAGAVVIKNIEIPGTYVGVPAKMKT